MSLMFPRRVQALAGDPAAEWEKLGEMCRADILMNPGAHALFKAGRQLLAAMRDTGLRLNDHCEDWPVPADLAAPPEDIGDGIAICAFTAHATLRRIGWIDQKGRVCTAIPPQAEFDGGSLTPLLIDVRED